MIPYLFANFLLFTLIAVGFIAMPKKIARENFLTAILLSPALGLAFLTCLLFFCSRIGIPVKELKYPFVALIVVLGILFSQRIIDLSVPSRALLGFIFIPLGTVLSSWPIFKYGFKWVSYFNDDMTNYVLGATRFYNFGYDKKPGISFFLGKDYSQAYYNLYSASGIRSGSELYLSSSSILVNGHVMQIFMTCLLSVHMVLIFTILGIGHIIWPQQKERAIVLYACLVISPLFSLGFLYQLFGQVGGLSFGILIIGLTLLIYRENYSTYSWRLASLIVLTFTAECIWYPEFLAFLLPAVLFILRWIIRNHKYITWKFVIVLLPLPLILNTYFFQAIKYGFAQVSRTTKSSSGSSALAELFPHFLKPHGLITLVGLEPMNRFFKDPWESILTVIALMILTFTAWYAAKLKKQINLFILTYMFMFTVFIYLVLSKNGFGSFKIAMYIQPFFLLAIVNGIYQVRENKRFTSSRILKFCALITTAIIGVTEIRTLQYYVKASTGITSRGFAEVQNASQYNIDSSVTSTLSKLRDKSIPVISTSFNLGLMKGESIAAKNTPLIFPGEDVFANIKLGASSSGTNVDYIREFIKTPWKENEFLQPAPFAHGSSSYWYLLSHDNSLPINNLSLPNPEMIRQYTLVKNPKDYLIFINSDQGQSYYNFGTSVSTASIFQPELNPMDKNLFMQGIGTNLLFEVVNPSANPILIFSGTNTVIPQYERKLPPLQVYDGNYVQTPLVGRGSARVRIPLKHLLRVNGHTYFQLHVSEDLLKFPQSNYFASNLYGKSIQIDNRKLSLFTTGINVKDKTEIEKWHAPFNLGSFPSDLNNKYLVYSGIYEDGWIGSESYFELSDFSKNSLKVSGSIPTLKNNPNFKTAIEVAVDGKIVISKELGGGDFNLSMPWKGSSSSASSKRVSIHFSNEQELPSPDGRPASAQIYFLGFR